LRRNRLWIGLHYVGHAEALPITYAAGWSTLSCGRTPEAFAVAANFEDSTFKPDEAPVRITQ